MPLLLTNGKRTRSNKSKCKFLRYSLVRAFGTNEYTAFEISRKPFIFAKIVVRTVIFRLYFYEFFLFI